MRGKIYLTNCLFHHCLLTGSLLIALKDSKKYSTTFSFIMAYLVAGVEPDRGNQFPTKTTPYVIPSTTNCAHIWWNSRVESNFNIYCNFSLTAMAPTYLI